MFAKDHTQGLNQTAYFGDLEDGYSQYMMYMNDRVVFLIYVSKAEEGMPIYVGKPGTDERIKTEYSAILAADGTRVSSMSVREQIYPRLAWILADLYAPAQD